MSEKPILFNTEMVRAILSGRKTQTRRAAFPERDLREFRSHKYPNGWWYRGNVFRDFESVFCHPDVPKCKYRPGDVLWVRETWAEMPYGYVYRADEEEPEGWDPDDRWHPSIHMPREAARIFLRVTGVRAERLQNMSDKDAQEEGIGRLFLDAIAFGDKDYGCMEYIDYKGWLGMEKEQFAHLWDTTIKKADLPLYGWDANPWVWVINFEKIDRPEAQT